GNTRCCLWSDSNSTWRAVFCVNDISQEAQTPSATATGLSGPNLVSFGSRCLMFQVQPNWLNTCIPWQAQSPHAGGINVCLGDGSVRFLSAGMSVTTWQNACDPQDGGPLGGDWN